MENRRELEETVIKKFKKSHAFKGISAADISNSVVRNILASISLKLYGEFRDEYIRETLEFFDWKCPYTGEPINDQARSFQIDHIVPQNKKDCGLNIRGNLVYSARRANELKNQLSAEDFLLIQNVGDDKRRKLEDFWEGTSLDVDTA